MKYLTREDAIRYLRGLVDTLENPSMAQEDRINLRKNKYLI